MVDAFEIDSKAKLVEIKLIKDILDTTKTLVFIDHDSKTIFLWRGKKATIFEKLIGTRVAAKLSHKYPKYRIRPIAEGEEPAAFKSLIKSIG
ncbi:MAG: hypothetical protein JSW61_14225 [Candidatus Thorarchaeota archaeon]|nr:MAG: hypothetical protein JSW61_14225 [Candidatus Thorarchaeota archaeon]